MKKQKKRLIWQLYPSYLLITLISLAAVSFYASRSFHDFVMTQTAANLVATFASAMTALPAESLLF